MVLVSLGGIIGAGFFLGSGLPIHTAGPAVLLAFLLGGLVTAVVTGALTSIAVNHPVRGSFKVYADMYLGRFAGYIQGWVYYITSILTISSEAVAMAIFTQLWIPNVPEWLIAGVYAALILLVNAFGLKNFDRIESMMSIVKLGALFLFIVLGLLILAGVLGNRDVQLGTALGNVLPNGWSDVLQSMLVVIFAFAGIGVFGTAAADVVEPRRIDKGAIWTVTSLTLLYILSIAVLLFLVPWNQVGTGSSPFVMALRHGGMSFAGTVFNAVILIAAFSVMAGSVFSANQILLSLGAGGEAPTFVNRRTGKDTPFGALMMTTGAVGLTLAVAFLLPANVYQLLISASSFFTFLNCLFILWTFLRWRSRRPPEETFMSRLGMGQPWTTFVTMGVIVVLTGYSLRQHDQRLGFYAALAVLLLVMASFVVQRRFSCARS